MTVSLCDIGFHGTEFSFQPFQKGFSYTFDPARPIIQTFEHFFSSDCLIADITFIRSVWLADEIA